MKTWQEKKISAVLTTEGSLGPEAPEGTTLEDAKSTLYGGVLVLARNTPHPTVHLNHAQYNADAI